MASSPVAFYLQDRRNGGLIPSKKIRRVCFRCDTRSPDEIFHGGFVSREIERKIEFAIEDAQEDVPGARPVLSPIGGVKPKHWKKAMLHPFAPGTEAAEVYESSFERYREQQYPVYRSTPDAQSKRFPMFDIASSTGVAVTYHADIAPIFPVDRGKDFSFTAWVYAVWVEEAVETFQLQRKDRPEIAAAEEIVVQYIPFAHVLGAVQCLRAEVEEGQITPLTFRMDTELRWNPHVSRVLYQEVYNLFQPHMGKFQTINDSRLKWEAGPKAPSLTPPNEPPPLAPIGPPVSLSSSSSLAPTGLPSLLSLGPPPETPPTPPIPSLTLGRPTRPPPSPPTGRPTRPPPPPPKGGGGSSLF